ncbi:MAG: ATP synthase F1 subunit delta [Acidobacteriota bacterium]
MLSVVAHRYARALVDVVISSHADAAQVLAGLRTVEKLIADSAELRHALSSPAVQPSRKHAVMVRLLEPMGLPEKVRNFVYVVIDHRRTAEFPSIVDGFEHLLDDRLGYVSADIRSAKELTEAQRQAIGAQVSRLAGKMAKLKFSTDPALIGGVVARVGSTVYDGSVRGQLDRLATKLSA